jgi:hypothetical protein
MAAGTVAAVGESLRFVLTMSWSPAAWRLIGYSIYLPDTSPPEQHTMRQGSKRIALA